MNEKIVDMLFTGIGVLCLSKVTVMGNIFKLNRWRKKEENEQSYHWYLLITFSRQAKADTFPILIRRDDGQSQTRVTCRERKDSTPYFPHCERDEETMQNSRNFRLNITQR